jgi:hypothetical protein
VVVTSNTVPEHASGEEGVTGPALFVGGAVLTNTVAVPDPVPPVGQVLFPMEVTVYVCVPDTVGVTLTLTGLLEVVAV